MSRLTCTSPGTNGRRSFGWHPSGERLFVDLEDGRTISVPLEWYPRLERGTPPQRANWLIIGAGWGLHWPDLDEDVNVPALLQGKPSTEFQGAPTST